MSQELREYRLEQLDDDSDEARRMHVTATVGPITDEDRTRGVQLTLETDNGYAYARVSEQQIQDLISVLSARITPEIPPTATGIEANSQVVESDGSKTDTHL